MKALSWKKPSLQIKLSHLLKNYEKLMKWVFYKQTIKRGAEYNIWKNKD
jgi:hypothetical protein